MYSLTFRLTGGHLVATAMPPDLLDAYGEDPESFGTQLDTVLKSAPLHVVEDLMGRRVFMRSEHVTGWEVDPA